MGASRTRSAQSLHRNEIMFTCNHETTQEHQNHHQTLKMMNTNLERKRDKRKFTPKSNNRSKHRTKRPCRCRSTRSPHNRIHRNLRSRRRNPVTKNARVKGLQVVVQQVTEVIQKTGTGTARSLFFACLLLSFPASVSLRAACVT